MTDPMESSALLKWAHVKGELKDARKEVLARNGLTEEGLRELELAAEAEMTSDEVEVMGGKVMKHRIPYFVHHNSEQKGERVSLYLRRP